MSNWYRGKDSSQSNSSNAEQTIFIALQKAGYNIGISTPPNSGITFNEEEDGVEGTFPDFLWPAQNVAVYIDGTPVHHTATQDRRDTLINNALEKHGYKWLRYPYIPPLTKKRCKEIVALIIKHLKRRGYGK